MKRDDHKLRLTHIISCIDKIESYVQDTYFDQFENNEMMQDAVIKNLEIIGEAATRLPKDFKKKNDHIPWSQIEGLRHRLVHDYYKVDLSIVWNTIKNRLPSLKDDITELVKEK